MSVRLSGTVRRAAADGGAPAVVRLARESRGPIVEPGPEPGSHDVTFVYVDRRRDAGRVGLFCPAIPGSFVALEAVADGVLAATFTLPEATRVKYHFSPHLPDDLDAEALAALSRSPTARRMDTLNPHYDRVDIRGLRLRMVESLLTLPGAVSGPPATAAPHVPAGTTTPFAVHSAALGRRKEGFVYRPAGCPADARRYPLVLLLQGNDEWREAAFLDNLVAEGRVRPFVAVLFTEHSLTARLWDNTCGAAYTRFVRDELLPVLAAEHSVSTVDVTVAGYSAGAVAAATLCLDEPRRFPRLATVSGALYLTPGTRLGRDPGSERLLERYRHATAVPRHAYLSAGRYEDLWRADVYTYTESLAGILGRHGARVRFDAGPTGHDTVSARGYLAEALAFLLGG
jgi:enterochelin esterase-like enzyme